MVTIAKYGFTEGFKFAESHCTGGAMLLSISGLHTLITQFQDCLTGDARAEAAAKAMAAQQTKETTCI